MNIQKKDFNFKSVLSGVLLTPVIFQEVASNANLPINSLTKGDYVNHFLWAKLNKNNTIEEYIESCAKFGYNKPMCYIDEVIDLEESEFYEYGSNLLHSNFSEPHGGSSYLSDVRKFSFWAEDKDFSLYSKEEREIISIFGYEVCKLIRCKELNIGYLSNQEGYKYSRYVGVLVSEDEIEQKKLQLEEYERASLLKIEEERKEKAEARGFRYENKYLIGKFYNPELKGKELARLIKTFVRTQLKNVVKISTSSHYVSIDLNIYLVEQTEHLRADIEKKIIGFTNHYNQFYIYDNNYKKPKFKINIFFN